MTKISREVKIDIIWAVLGGVLTVAFCAYAYGCSGVPATPVIAAKYQADLEECNRTATNLCESIACENRYRQSVHHPLRVTPSHCYTDGGSKDGS